MTYVEDLENRVIELEEKLESQVVISGSIAFFKRLFEDKIAVSKSILLIKEECSLEWEIAKDRIRISEKYLAIIKDIQEERRNKKKKRLDKQRKKLIIIKGD